MSTELGVANPVVLDLPLVTLGWWSAYFGLLVDGADSFDTLYAPSRTQNMLEDIIADPAAHWWLEDARLYDLFEVY